MDVFTIRTARDLRRALSPFAAVHYLALTDAGEAAARRELEAMFEDYYSLIDPDVDEPAFVTALLDSSAQYLPPLYDMGLQLVGIRGTNAGTTTTYFVLAPEPLWFSPDDNDRRLVHLLGASCPYGHAALARERVDVTCWFDRNDLEQAFEQAVPWCATCSIAEISAG